LSPRRFPPDPDLPSPHPLQAIRSFCSGPTPFPFAALIWGRLGLLESPLKRPAGSLCFFARLTAYYSCRLATLESPPTLPHVRRRSLAQSALAVAGTLISAGRSLRRSSLPTVESSWHLFRLPAVDSFMRECVAPRLGHYRSDRETVRLPSLFIEGLPLFPLFCCPQARSCLKSSITSSYF